MNYSRAKQAALRMISKNGLTYQASRGGGVETIKGIERQKEELKFEIKGVRFNYSNYEIVNSQSSYALASSLIQSGDIKLMTTADVDILVGDLIEIDGKQWRVVNSKPFKPADEIIYYELQLRC